MANIKHYSDDILLTHITGFSKRSWEATFPGIKGRALDSFDNAVGYDATFVPFFDHGAGKWNRGAMLPVTRVVTYKSNPSKHECDARCINATGRTMQCECSCGGKNHGRGSSIKCEAA